MIFNDLAEKFNAESKALGELVKDKKFDEALKHIDNFEKEVKPMLNSCEMTCSDFSDREKFNVSLRKDAITLYEKCETIAEKKASAEMYNMAQKELYDLGTSWKAVVKQFENTLDQGKGGISNAKQQAEKQEQKA